MGGVKVGVVVVVELGLKWGGVRGGGMMGGVKGGAKWPTLSNERPLWQGRRGRLQVVLQGGSTPLLTSRPRLVVVVVGVWWTRMLGLKRMMGTTLSGGRGRRGGERGEQGDERETTLMNLQLKKVLRWYLFKRDVRRRARAEREPHIF